MKLKKGNQPIAAISVYVYNFLDLRQKIQEIVDCGIKWIHVDIMDGKFVKNYAFGQRMVHDIKESFPEIVIDAHLACEKAELSIESFAKSNCDYYIFHYEGLIQKDELYIAEICKKIHDNGMNAVLAFDYNTDFSNVIKGEIENLVDGVMLMTVPAGGNGQLMDTEIQIKRIKKLVDIRNNSNNDWLVITDGGCRENTYLDLCESQADVIVVGAFVNVEKDKIQEQVNKIQNYGKVI